MSSTPTVAWRALLPPFLTEPWRRLHSGIDDAPRRFGYGVAVVDVLGRYLVALFSAAADEPHKTREYRLLLDRLARPTLGMWWDAADRLAGFVPEDDGPVHHAARAIRDPTVRAVLDALIAERNEVAHPCDGVTQLTPTEAERRLADLRPRLERVADAFGVLADARLCHVVRQHTNPQGQTRVDIVQFRAREHLMQRDVLVRGLPTDVALVVEPSGRVLMLDPWVRVDPDHRDGPTPTLFHRSGDAGPVWVAHDGHTRTGWAWVDPATLSVASRRKPGAITPSVAERLCGMGEDRGSPRIEGWKVGGLVGTGGTAAVWRGQRADDPSGRLFALKVVHEPLKAAPDLLERLRREADVGRRLQHPHLVGVEGVVETDDGRLVVVQEFVEGRTLEDRFADDPPSAGALVALVRQVAAALEHLHANGVLHRDVKPSNVLVDASGHARLADLGLAALDVDYRLTRTGQGLGTPAFAAPEQIEGRGNDGRSDVYSLGRVLQEGLIKVPGGIEAAPAPLRRIVRRATSKDPDERFAGVADMRAALDAADLFEDGCPVGLGDVLGGLRVQRAGRRLQGVDVAVWEVVGRDAAGQDSFVAVGLDGPPGDWIRAKASAGKFHCQRHDGLVFAVSPKGSQKPWWWDSGTLVGAGGLMLGAAGLLAGASLAAAAVAGAAAGRRAAADSPRSPTSGEGEAPPEPARGPSALPADEPRAPSGEQPSPLATLGRLLGRAALRSAVGPAAPAVEAALRKTGGPPKK